MIIYKNFKLIQTSGHWLIFENEKYITWTATLRAALRAAGAIL